MKTQQEIISLHEAAQQLGISYAAITNWLRSHKSFTEKYCSKAVYDGRKKTTIKVEGLVVMATVKDSDRGNQRKNKPGKLFHEGKEKIAEKALSPDANTVRLLIHEVQSLKMMVESLMPKPHPLALPMATEEPAPISYRALINQRIRKFAQENDLEFFEPWSRLYEEIYYRLGVNVRKRAEKNNLKPIDVLASEGILEDAWKLCCKLFKLKTDK